MARKTQLNIAFDEPVRDYLEARAKEDGLSIGEEIRLRVDLTMLMDRVDPDTQRLLSMVEHFSRQIYEVKEAHWHEHPKSYEAFVTAVMQWLEDSKPRSSEVAGRWGEEENAQTVGRTIADIQIAERHRELLRAVVKHETGKELPEHFTASEAIDALGGQAAFYRLAEKYRKERPGKKERGKS